MTAVMHSESMQWRAEWPTLVHDRLLAVVELPGHVRICRREPGRSDRRWHWYRHERIAHDLDQATEHVIELHMRHVVECDRVADRDRRLAVPMPRTRERVDDIERARRYVAQMDPSVAGQQGAAALFRAASVLVRGFALSLDDALPLLEEYDAQSDPPWGERECKRALRSARARGRMEIGALLRASMRRAS